MQSIRHLLMCLDVPVDQPSVEETPLRMFHALQEMTSGYRMDPKEILAKRFQEPTDEIIVVRRIEFQSICEHHILPFFGTADVAYLPKDSVVGLSKIARLVDCYARRMQVQERMATQIADAMIDHLNAKGVAVVVRASHLCMCIRGVRKQSAETIVSVMRGTFRESAPARAEVMELLRS